MKRGYPGRPVGTPSAGLARAKHTTFTATQRALISQYWEADQQLQAARRETARLDDERNRTLAQLHAAGLSAVWISDNLRPFPGTRNHSRVRLAIGEGRALLADDKSTDQPGGGR